jgi:hypothetical protein
MLVSPKLAVAQRAQAADSSNTNENLLVITTSSCFLGAEPGKKDFFPGSPPCIEVIYIQRLILFSNATIHIILILP